MLMINRHYYGVIKANFSCISQWPDLLEHLIVGISLPLYSDYAAFGSLCIFYLSLPQKLKLSTAKGFFPGSQALKQWLFPNPKPHKDQITFLK